MHVHLNVCWNVRHFHLQLKLCATISLVVQLHNSCMNKKSVAKGSAGQMSHPVTQEVMILLD